MLERQEVRPLVPATLPRTHENCQQQYSCNRPGKTARDKSKGNYQQGKNVRIWDTGSRTWVKV